MRYVDKSILKFFCSIFISKRKTGSYTCVSYKFNLEDENKQTELEELCIAEDQYLKKFCFLNVSPTLLRHLPFEKGNCLGQKDTVTFFFSIIECQIMSYSNFGILQNTFCWNIQNVRWYLVKEIGHFQNFYCWIVYSYGYISIQGCRNLWSFQGFQ